MPCGEPDAGELARPVRRAGASRPPRVSEVWRLAPDPASPVGRAFVKACCYAPYPLWLCLNGHEWAKRQAEQAGIGYQPLENGFRACADADALAAICARL